MTSLAKLFLTDGQLKAIGEVAVEWSYAELYLEALIWEILEIDELTGHSITTHIGSETRIDILATLSDIKISNPARKDELKKLLNGLRDTRARRNEIVHSIWTPSRTQSIEQMVSDFLAKKKRRKPTPASMRIQARGKLKITNKLLSTKYIKSVASSQSIAVFFFAFFRIDI